MKPSSVSRELRRIAAGIEKCEVPRPDLVNRDLRRVVAALPTSVQVANYLYNGSILVTPSDPDELQKLIDSIENLDEANFKPSVNDMDFEMHDVMTVKEFKKYLEDETDLIIEHDEAYWNSR